LARSSLNVVDVGSPVSTEAGPFPAKSRRSCRRTNVTACRCRRQPTDDACTAVVHNEFDVDSVAAGCVDHVDPLGRRTPVGRTSLLSARVSYSRYADNAQSATAFGNCLFFSAPGRVAEYCDERACLSVCLFVRDHIFGTTSPTYTKFFAYVTYGRGSVLLSRRSDTCMLCTSGFMDDVKFAHKPRLLDVAAQLNRSAHSALSLAIKCAQ